MRTRKTAGGLWVPANASASAASDSADVPRLDDSHRPARGIVFGFLSCLAMWALVAVAVLTVLS